MPRKTIPCWTMNGCATIGSSAPIQARTEETRDEVRAALSAPALLIAGGWNSAQTRDVVYKAVGTELAGR